MKKFLSLVLALVMTMSLVTISAGAKDFTDADKVNYDEAIAVLSAVKVIDGYTDGSFKPQTPLNRGQAAKIICNLVLGPTTAAELSATVAPFSDVPANNIFAGYITYCANEGIICGYGDGTFRPTGSLTGYAFLKMLLGALGYDADIEGYNNPGSFGIQVAKQAIGIGLNKGLKDTFDGNKTVTREEACLYALNTLKATMVEYDQKIVANVNGAQVTVGTSLAKEVKWNIAEKKNDGNIKDDEYVQFAEKYFPKLELEVGNGIYGRPTNVWKLKKVEIGAFTSIEPTYVYTESVKEKDAYKDLGKVICDETEYDWTAFVNGKDVDAKTYAPAKNGPDEWAYTGEGTVTEIYVDDDAETVTVCEINYYLGEVSKVKKDDDGEYITVKALSDGGKTLDDKTFYVEGYEEDDYVVYTIDENEDGDFVIGEVCEPETATVEVTRVDQDDNTGATYLKANGDKYVYSEADPDDVPKDEPAQQQHMVFDLDGTLGEKVHPALNEEYILYLDPNGYVLGFKLADEEETKYLYVLDSDEEMGDWQAKVLFADGTTGKIDVKTEVKNFGLTNNSYGYKASTKSNITWTDGSRKPLTDGNQDIKVQTSIDKLIFSYTVNSKNEYTLTCVKQGAVESEKNDAGKWEPDAKINNGRAYVTIGKNDYIVDSKTVFTDKEGETAYIGYKEVPNVEHADIAFAYDPDNGKILDIIFILDGIIYDKDSTYFVLTKDTRESLKYDDDLYWDYSKAYVNGEKQNVIVAYDALVGGKVGVKLVPGTLYKATKTIDEKYITEVEKVTANYDGTVYGEVETVGVDAFWLKKGNTYTESKEVKFDVNDETVFVLVEEHLDENGKNDSWTVSDGNINDLKAPDDAKSLFVQVVEKDDETAELVYIFLTTQDGKKVEKPGDYNVAFWAASDSGNVNIAFQIINDVPGENGTFLTQRKVAQLGLKAEDFVLELDGYKYTGVEIKEYGTSNTLGDGTQTGGFVKVNFGEKGSVLGSGDYYNADGHTDTIKTVKLTIDGVDVNVADGVICVN